MAVIRCPGMWWTLSDPEVREREMEDACEHVASPLVTCQTLFVRCFVD